MRGLRTVERELAQVEQLLARADQLDPVLDNEGRVVLTPAQVRASHRRRAARLRAERADLRKALGLGADNARADHDRALKLAQTTGERNREMQRAADLEHLSRWVAELPASHQDRPGGLRAIEVLKYSPLLGES